MALATGPHILHMVELMNTSILKLKDLSDNDLENQMMQDANHIFSKTPLDEDTWEDSTVEYYGVRLAHAVVEFSKRIESIKLEHSF
jgi:hypothetical protein